MFTIWFKKGLHSGYNEMCFKKYGHSFFSALILRKIQHLLFYFVEGIDNFIKFGRILCVVFSFETIISRPKNAKVL